MTEFDYGSESEKLGGVLGVLQLKDGQEVTLVVTGPIVECQDRFGTQAPRTKYLLGVYNVDSKTRCAVNLSWKAKGDWDSENKKRPFSQNMVRWSRVGATKETTRYTVVCFTPITPQVRAELAASAPFDVRAAAAELTRRSKEPRDEAPAPAQGYSHPGNGGGQAPAATVAPVSQAPVLQPSATVGTQNGAAYVKQLEQADAALASGYADVSKVSDHVRQLLMAAVGRDAVLAIRDRVGGQAGVPLDVLQVRAAIREGIKTLSPPSALAADVAGVGNESDIPF